MNKVRTNLTARCRTLDERNADWINTALCCLFFFSYTVKHTIKLAAVYQSQCWRSWLGM